MGKERIVGFSFHLHNGRTTMHFVLSFSPEI
jgi:hypothetical protein